MIRRLGLATILIATMATPALADAIEGNWRTKSGEIARISKCGSSFCIKLTTGEYSGKSIGKFKASGGKYNGEITDPTNDKTYKGKASLSGSTLKMSGCVLGGLICRSENWKKR